MWWGPCNVGGSLLGRVIRRAYAFKLIVECKLYDLQARNHNMSSMILREHSLMAFVLHQHNPGCVMLSSSQLHAQEQASSSPVTHGETRPPPVESLTKYT